MHPCVKFTAPSVALDIPVRVSGGIFQAPDQSVPMENR